MNLQVYIDGGSRGNPGPAAAGVVIHAGDKTLLQAGFFLGKMTSNQAEYHALLRALVESAKHHPEELVIYSDSELLVRQLVGKYKVRNAVLQKLHERAHAHLARLGNWQIHHLPREQNRLADELANAALNAKRDVVREPAATAPAVRKPRRRLIIRVEEPPAEGRCPAGMQAGDIYYLSEVMPAMLCTHLAQAIMQVSVAMLDAEREMPEVPVRCRRPGCGALVTIAVEHPDN